jgi:hypothetical protein
MTMRRLPKCPCCGCDLPIRNLNFARPFDCPGCKSELKISRFYSTLFSLLGLTLSFGISFAVGLRGTSLVVVGFLGWMPAAGIVLVAVTRLFPPELTAIDEQLIQ